MPDTVIAASLSLDSSQAEQSVKSFKTQLREAQSDVIRLSEQFGELAPQTLAAARNVAELRDTIGDAAEVSRLFDPGARFAAFGNVLSTVTGGFSALTGTMALFETSSEDVQKTIEKLSEAMSIVQGANAIRDSLPQFQRLGAIIQQTTIFQKANNAATTAAAAIQRLFTGAVDTTSTSFKVLKGAIAATGIGLLIVGIGELVSVIQNYTSAAEDAAKAQDELNKRQKRIKRLPIKNGLANIARDEKLAIERAKAAGKSEQDIFDIQQDYLERRLHVNKEYQEQLQQDDAEGYTAANNAIKDLNAEKEIQQLQFQQKQRENSASESKKAASEADARHKQEVAKAKQNAAELLQVQKAAEEELRKLQQANYLRQITDEFDQQRAKIKQDIADETERINQLNISANTRRLILTALRQQEIDELYAVDVKDKEKKDEAKKTEDERILERTNEAVGKLNMATLARVTAAQKESDDIKMTDEELYAWRKKTIESFLSNAAALFGKHTLAYKVLAITQATINAYLGISDALAAKTYTIFDTVVKFANATAIGIAGFTNVAKIAGVGGGGGSAPTPSIPNAPLIPQNTQTSLDQNSLNQIGNATARSFVLDVDITNAQERQTRINRSARLGG